MAKISFTTNVQSLGREDIGQPGRESDAKVQTIQAAQRFVVEGEKALAAAEYTKNMSEAKNSISELYDTVVSKERFTSSEIPEYVTGFERYREVTDENGQVQVVENVINASEVREQWFKQGMQNITNTIVKSSKFPTARYRISDEMRRVLGPAAYQNLLKYNREASRKERLAELDMSVQEGIVNGDRFGVEATLSRFLEVGDISLADYKVRQLAASQNLDIEAYSKGIATVEGEGQLDALEDQLSQNMSQTMPGQSDMTAAQRNTLRASVNSQRAAFKAEKAALYEDTEQEGLALYTEGRLTPSWIRAQMRNDTMQRPAGQALIGLLEGGASAKAIDPFKVSSWQSEVQSRIMFTELGIQTSDEAAAMKRELQDSDLSGAERVQVYDYIVKLENQIRDNPEYKQALFSIRLSTGMPESEDFRRVEMLKSMGEYGNILKITEEFSNALFQYIDEFGAEAKPFEFVQKNKDKYNLEDISKKKQTRFEEAYPELVSPGPTGTSDPKVILHKLYQQYTESGSNNLDLEKTIAEVYTFWYGTPLDTGNL